MIRFAHLLETEWVAQRRKALVALIALAGQAVALGLVHGSALQAVTLALGVAGALGVHQIPNGTPAVEEAPEAGHSQVDTLLLVAVTVGVVLLLFGVTWR